MGTSDSVTDIIFLSDKGGPRKPLRHSTWLTYATRKMCSRKHYISSEAKPSVLLYYTATASSAAEISHPRLFICLGLRRAAWQRRCVCVLRVIVIPWQASLSHSSWAGEPCETARYAISSPTSCLHAVHRQSDSTTSLQTHCLHFTGDQQSRANIYCDLRIMNSKEYIAYIQWFHNTGHTDPLQKYVFATINWP